MQEASDIVTQKEHDIDTYVKISQLYYDNKDYEKAMEILEKAMEIDAQNENVREKYVGIGFAYIDYYIEKKIMKML